MKNDKVTNDTEKLAKLNLEVAQAKQEARKDKNMDALAYLDGISSGLMVAMELSEGREPELIAPYMDTVKQENGGDS